MQFLCFHCYVLLHFYIFLNIARIRDFYCGHLHFTKPICLTIFDILDPSGPLWSFSSNAYRLMSSFAVAIGTTVLKMFFMCQVPYKRFELNKSAFRQRSLENHVFCFHVIGVSWLLRLIIFCRQPFANWHVYSSTNVYIGMLFIMSTLKMIWCLLVCYCCAKHCITYFPRFSIKIYVLLHEKLNLLEQRTNSCEKIICVNFFM